MDILDVDLAAHEQGRPRYRRKPSGLATVLLFLLFLLIFLGFLQTGFFPLSAPATVSTREGEVDHL